MVFNYVMQTLPNSSDSLGAMVFIILYQDEMWHEHNDGSRGNFRANLF